MWMQGKVAVVNKQLNKWKKLNLVIDVRFSWKEFHPDDFTKQLLCKKFDFQCTSERCMVVQKKSYVDVARLVSIINNGICIADL